MSIILFGSRGDFRGTLAGKTKASLAWNDSDLAERHVEIKMDSETGDAYLHMVAPASVG